MHKKRVGRNEPCPCGSGKKYKKCCYRKNIFNNSTKSKNIQHILPPHDTINYGQPLLDETFLKQILYTSYRHHGSFIASY